MSYPCRELILKFQEVARKLLDAGIDPSKATADIATMVELGVHVPENVYELYVELLRLKSRIRRCIWWNYVRERA